MSVLSPSSVARRLRLVLLAAVCAPALAAAQSATITGRVTAVNGAQPLAEARVFVVGTQAVATTNGEGRFTIRTAPGTFDVRVIRVGYQEQKQTVTVAANGSANADFSLVAAVVKLTEIVTTATGEQRRVELGHSVTTLGDIAVKVEQAPVTNLTDLLTAKAPGLVVLPGNMTGSAPTVRIRGIKSVSLSSSPIYVIDGVRMNSTSIDLGTGGTNASLLNAINPEEIADIEIVKGPSAATLYGTDAANGVIVITTKKGASGSIRWQAHGEGGSVKDDNTYPTQYSIFGKNAAGTVTRCVLVTIASGACKADSTTSYNLIGDPQVSPKATGYNGQGGGQVSGGTDALRFFVSGDVEREQGPLEMPEFFRNYFDSLGIKDRSEWVHPEQFKRNSLRTNLNTVLSPKFDLGINTSYSKTSQQLPQVDNNVNSYYYQAYNNPGFKPTAICRTTPAACLGYTNVGSLGETLGGYASYTPAQLFQLFSNLDVDRFINSANAQFRPYSWLRIDGTTGLDYSTRDNFSICRLNECANFSTNRAGFVNETRSTARNISGKLLGTATWQARPTVNLQTTVGSDYTNQQTENTAASGTQLPPGAQTVGAAAVRNGTLQLPTADKTLGYYIQEQVAFRDRLFITGAVRTDQNSAFGTKFQRVVYPKLSASYILSDEAFFPRNRYLTSLRLRSAYGQSGVQPGSTTSLQTFGASTVNLPATAVATTGLDSPGLIQNALGNPDLKPERSAEREAGFEAGFFNSRLNLDFTYYNNQTSDALYNQPIAASSGAAGPNLVVTRNLGSTSNKGIEATITSQIIDRRNFGWNVTLGGSHNTNKVESLGFDANGNPNPTNGTATFRDSVGLPIRGFFARGFTYADANGNGIIELSEVKIDAAVSYFGNSVPRDIVTFQNGFDLFQRKLHLNFLFDYKGGYSLLNQTTQFYCLNTNTCYDETHTNVSLDLQARLIAQRYANPTTIAGYIENGQFWRFREFGATLSLPNGVNNALRVRDASLTFSARNLHVWTAYTGVDPESAYGEGNTQTDFSTTSPPRRLSLRLNLHF